MVYRGHVKNGVVVLDEPAALPEGAEVQITLPRTRIMNKPVTQESEGPAPTLFERLAPVIGAAEGLPSDLAENHDHYLYGVPKK